MKVCQINCVYGEGSTGKIVRDIHISLKEQGVESFAIAPTIPEACKGEVGVYAISNRLLSNITASYRRLLGRQFDGAWLQTNRILQILKREKPDVVHLHCLNGNNINVYSLYRYLARKRIKTLITLHAEFPYTGGCGHAFDCEQWKTGCKKCSVFKQATQSVFIDGTCHTWTAQKKSLDLFDADKFHITAVSPWLVTRAKQSPMLDRFNMSVIYNGIDINVFHPYDKVGWRNKLGIKRDEKMIFFVTASFEPHIATAKGGHFIVKLANLLQSKNVKFVVAANVGNSENLPSNMIYLGRTKNQVELAELYSIADLSIITSRRETFSMPVAESLCCGTPIVGFKAGGPESIAIKEYSEFAEYGDVESLLCIVEKWLSNDKKSIEISTKAHDTYSRVQMTNNYIKLYKEI